MLITILYKFLQSGAHSPLEGKTPADQRYETDTIRNSLKMSNFELIFEQD